MEPGSSENCDFGAPQTIGRQSMIRVKSSWIWRLAVILAVASVSLRGLADVPDPEWWPSSTTDKDWTNRSVAALRDEALRNSTPGQYHLARQHFVGIDGRRDL